MSLNPPITDEPVASFGEALAILTHPAFRLGFLDAQAGRPLDHELILDRIERETPPGALERLGWQRWALFSDEAYAEAALAQYRYEEGRLLQREFGLACKAWGHPDYPPIAVAEWLFNRFPVTTPTLTSPSAEEVALKLEEAGRQRKIAAAERQREAEMRARQGALAL